MAKNKRKSNNRPVRAPAEDPDPGTVSAYIDALLHLADLAVAHKVTKTGSIHRAVYATTRVIAELLCVKWSEAHVNDIMMSGRKGVQRTLSAYAKVRSATR